MFKIIEVGDTFLTSLGPLAIHENYVVDLGLYKIRQESNGSEVFCVLKLLPIEFSKTLMNRL